MISLVGNTPLLRLNSVTKGIGATVLAKVEYFNPGGSVKDRIALRMIEAAERSGALRPGGTIVEPTSGNTGVGLAIVAQRKGYQCVFVCPDKVSEDNPASHYHSTGPELWRQTDGRITHFVAGVGTGGTITGTGRYLKEVSQGRVQIIGADPEGSVYSGGTGRPYLVEGVGEDFWPETYDKTICDRIIEVSDADSFAVTRRLAREEAMLVGGSAGMAAAAAIRLAHELSADPAADDMVIVVLLPDGGRGYLTKVFNDDWLAQYGFLAGGPEGTTLRDVLATKDGSMPPLVHTHPNETIAEAIEILREYNVSQMPVVRAEPPVMAAEVAGAVSTKALMDALFVGHARLADRVEQHMEPPLPSLGANEPVSKAVELLEKADALMVLDDGKPVGVITRQDLLGHLATG